LRTRRVVVGHECGDAAGAELQQAPLAGLDELSRDALAAALGLEVVLAVERAGVRASCQRPQLDHRADVFRLGDPQGWIVALQAGIIFIRAMTRRNEKVVQDLVRHGGEAIAAHARDTAAIVARLEDLTAESRAQREGLLAAIDRLPPQRGM
jgi:hypothetical protein